MVMSSALALTAVFQQEGGYLRTFNVQDVKNKSGHSLQNVPEKLHFSLQLILQK